jgi:hypothetical protein
VSTWIAQLNQRWVADQHVVRYEKAGPSIRVQLARPVGNRHPLSVGAETQIDGHSVTSISLHPQPKAVPLQRHNADLTRGRNWLDDQLRHDALLGAYSAVCVLGAVAT